MPDTVLRDRRWRRDPRASTDAARSSRRRNRSRRAPALRRRGARRHQASRCSMRARQAARGRSPRGGRAVAHRPANPSRFGSCSSGSAGWYGSIGRGDATLRTTLAAVPPLFHTRKNAHVAFSVMVPIPVRVNCSGHCDSQVGRNACRRRAHNVSRQPARGVATSGPGQWPGQSVAASRATESSSYRTPPAIIDAISSPE